MTFFFVELYSKSTIGSGKVLTSRDVNDWEHHFNQIQYAKEIVQTILDWITTANISKSQIIKRNPLILGNQLQLQVSECVKITFKSNKVLGYH